MKTILTFLALATALCGQVGPKASNLLREDNAAQSAPPAIDWSALRLSTGTKADVTLTTRYDILWSADNAAGKLLSVSGITQIVPVPLQGNPHLWLTRQKAPEKPEEIEVYVWTADGRKFRAKWEEVK